MSLSFTFVTPKRLLVKDAVESVTLPTERGKITVLPHHTHVVVDLDPGEMHYATKDKEGLIAVTRYHIERGIAEMSHQGALTVFVTGAQEVK